MITSIFAFVVAFGVLVLVHEFGHFWVARRVGIDVEKFSIGFGPKIFGFQWRETDFRLSLLPLGGFVKMKGEGEETQAPSDDPKSFSNKPLWARGCVVLAGPFMNLVLSFVLMPLVFWIGKSEATFLSQPPVVERVLPASPAEKAGLQIGDRLLTLEGKPASNWEGVLQTLALSPAGKKIQIEFDRKGTKESRLVETAPLPSGEGTYLGIEKFFGKSPEAVAVEVVGGSPADLAGLQRGDRISEINSKPVTDWDGLIREVNAHGRQSLTVSVLRGISTLHFRVQPKWDEENRRYLMGLRGPEGSLAQGLIQIRQYSFGEALRVGFKTNVKNIVMTFGILKKLVTLELSYKSLGGPVQIAHTLGKASAAGLAEFLYLTAFLSLQLAILNILPVPMLDGGHLLFFLIEGIQRRPLSLKVRILSQQIGLVLLLTLICAVTFNDLERLLGFSQWFKHFFR